MRRIGAGMMFGMALTVMAPSGGYGQIAKSPPPDGVDRHSMAPGLRYRAGGFTKWLLGSDYRELWLTPIEAPVLNLDSVGGGLTPQRTGGFGQSVTLHFDGRDGRRYIVRSIDKDPTKRLLPDLKGTFVETLIQDQISSLLPSAALVVDPLLAAAGILHARHRLVIIPDDPRLGEFREEFAGLLGMLVLHPDEGADDTPGFAGSERIIGTEQFLDRLEDDPCDRVDARTFLRARLMDMLIGDRDRHAGQWRWARYPDGDCNIWQPIPEDRDQAFVDYDGFVMWITRRLRPAQIRFGGDYPNLTGLTFNAWELDRELLVELDRPVWDSVVAEIRFAITDDVIENAVRQMPEPHYRSVGERLTDALKERRDKLHTVATDYYRLISRWAEIKATDEPEYVELTRRPGGELEVTIAELHPSRGTQDEPYFRRVFRPEVTKEVRLYLRGGDDRARVRGAAGGIDIRIDGGGDDDRFENTSQGGGVAFYDSRGDNVFVTGVGAKVDRSEFERPPTKDPAHRFALDWGGRGFSLPLFGYSPDAGLFVGTVVSHERYGYRKAPFKTHHALNLGVVTTGPEVVATYRGTFRQLVSGVDGVIDLGYSGIDFLRFHGFGNETVLTGSSSFFKLSQRDLTLAPGLVFTAGRNRGGGAGSGAEPLRQEATFSFGPVLKYSDTPLDGDNAARFIGSLDPPPYGSGSFAQFGVRGTAEYDSRNNSGFPTSGVRLEFGGAVYPEVLDVTSTFGEVHGTASVYLSAPTAAGPTLALRAGGKRVWGDFPFLEAAYLGGSSGLRGFREQRFAGDAAVFGNAELRFRVFNLKLLVPAEFGLFGLADAGRVFFDGDPAGADEIHVGVGGGFWLSFINRLQTISVAIANGDDLTGLYISAGFLY